MRFVAIRAACSYPSPYGGMLERSFGQRRYVPATAVREVDARTVCDAQTGALAAKYHTVLY